MEQFECIIDRWGNLIVASGWVYQHSSQALAQTAADPNISLPSPRGAPTAPGMPATVPASATFIGGSGRLIVATPSVTLANPAAVLAVLGFYTPEWDDTFRSIENPEATIGFSSPALGKIHDGSGIIAEWASGADAPLGVYEATTYGKDTYNEGSDFEITVTEELTGGRLPAMAEVYFSAGTAQNGAYYPSDAQNFSNYDPDWTITIDPDGLGEIKYLGTVVATRTTAENWDDPSGTYESTTYGETNFNGGDAFTAEVRQRNAYPRSGYAIVQCNMSGGDLISVAKPFFSASIPANTSTETYVPIFYSNGSTIAQQLHTGMIFIP